MNINKAIDNILKNQPADEAISKLVESAEDRLRRAERALSTNRTYEGVLNFRKLQQRAGIDPGELPEDFSLLFVTAAEGLLSARTKSPRGYTMGMYKKHPVEIVISDRNNFKYFTSAIRIMFGGLKKAEFMNQIGELEGIGGTVHAFIGENYGSKHIARVDADYGWAATRTGYSSAIRGDTELTTWSSPADLMDEMIREGKARLPNLIRHFNRIHR